MADNVELNSMSGGRTVATDQISSVDYQRIKLIQGADGVNDGDVSTSLPLPVRFYLGLVAVSAGAGAVDTGTQRTTHASDDPVTTALQTMDDWDESDRAKVNPIVGQAGIAGGPGAAGATVIRTVTATDSPDVTALQVMDDWDNAASDGASVSGDVAHDGADAGEPIKGGGKAIAHGANPTAVAAADRTNWYFTRHGIPFVIGGHMNVLTASANVTDADGAQTDAALITVSAGTIIIVVHAALTASKANTGTSGIQFRMGFGTASTPAEDAAGQILNHPGVAPGGGEVVGTGSGIVGIGADGSDLRYTCADPVGGSITVNVGYFTIES